jgi:hypothetical protein
VRIITVFAAVTVPQTDPEAPNEGVCGGNKVNPSVGSSVYNQGLQSNTSTTCPDQFRAYLWRVADYRDDIGSRPISGSENVSVVTVKPVEHLEDPPEDYQHDTTRTCISLGVQIISRFFVSEILCGSSGRSTHRFTKGLKYDLQCTRAEMFSRVSFFHKVGRCCLLFAVCSSLFGTYDC